MQLTTILFALYAYALFPLAHALNPRATLQNCHNVERLDKTVQRMHPILFKLADMHKGHSSSAPNNVTVTTGGSGHGRRHAHGDKQARDVSDIIKKIDALQALLSHSQEKIASKRLTCQTPTTGAQLLKARDLRVRDDDKEEEEEDDDDDDEQCGLDDVIDELLEAVECLLSFLFGLLGGIVELVFHLLEGVAKIIGEMLDLD